MNTQRFPHVRRAGIWMAALLFGAAARAASDELPAIPPPDCDVASATFRNANGGTNATGHFAAPPVLGEVWTAYVDNRSTGNTFAGIVGYGGPAETYQSAWGGYLLVDVMNDSGELLALAPKAGSEVVEFSLLIPDIAPLCGASFSTQGFGFGGGAGLRLHNAYDLKIGREAPATSGL